jgi:F0F1-type ATP synthase delta subunit
VTDVDTQTQGKEFILPLSLVGRIEVSRLLRELEKIDNDLSTQTIRGAQNLPTPVVSKVLSDVIQANRIDIVNEAVRKQLVTILRDIKDKAPVLQVTFASSPDPQVIFQIVEWFRANLHPTTLITVGLQPGIVGGCVVRTPDHIYDFSLKRQFRKHIPMLAEEIRSVIYKS